LGSRSAVLHEALRWPGGNRANRRNACGAYRRLDVRNAT
jgi:hypothetical protein